MNRKIHTLFFLLLALFGSLLYFREYINAFYDGFTNFYVTCADFGQYSNEVHLYFQEKFLVDSLVPDKEPGIFLVAIILGKIIWLSAQFSLLFTTFIGQFLSLFFIGSLTRKMTKKGIYWFIAIFIALTTYQLSFVYVQLVSRQLFSTTFLLLASNFYLTARLVPRIFFVSSFLAMSFISHRFWGIVGFWAVLLWLVINIIKFHRVNYIYIAFILLAILFSWPFLYFLWDYFLVVFNSKKDLFIGSSSAVDANKFNWGFSWLSESSNIIDTPILHYFYYQPFYLIFWCANFIFLIKYFKGKRFLFFYIFLSLLIYTFLKVTFSIRSLISFEIFLIPIIWLSFCSKSSRLLKIIVIFSFVFLWITGIQGRVPMLKKKIIPKDSSILFIEKNYRKENTLFLSWVRCESDMLGQLFYSTSENLDNDNLKWLQDIRSKEILSYTFAREIAERNYRILISNHPYLHEIMRWKDIYIFFWNYTKSEVLASLKNRTHPIFQAPYLSLVYENPQAKLVRYIFKLDLSQVTFFDNWYYLRDIKNIP